MRLLSRVYMKEAESWRMTKSIVWDVPMQLLIKGKWNKRTHQRCFQIQKAVQRCRMTLLGPGLCGRGGSLIEAALVGWWLPWLHQMSWHLQLLESDFITGNQPHKNNQGWKVLTIWDIDIWLSNNSEPLKYLPKVCQGPSLISLGSFTTSKLLPKITISLLSPPSVYCIVLSGNFKRYWL